MAPAQVAPALALLPRRLRAPGLGPLPGRRPGLERVVRLGRGGQDDQDLGERTREQAPPPFFSLLPLFPPLVPRRNDEKKIEGEEKTHVRPLEPPSRRKHKSQDLATGKLRLTLTGHIEQVTGLAISARHPYLFSCSLDKEVKCWDLEANKVVRNYHGHLSGVFCVGLHPALDVLVSGGRDSTARVWDMRSRVQAACLTGHADAVCSLFCQSSDPQVVTGSADKTVKLWDIRKTPAKAVGEFFFFF